MNYQLIIGDSNSEDRRQLANHLRAARIATREADTYQELITEIRAESYDVIIVALSIHGGGGIWAVSEIRSITKAPVIAIAEDDTEQDRVRALRVGADIALSRPIRHHEIVLQSQSLIRIKSEGEYAEPMSWVLAGTTLSIDPKKRRICVGNEVIHLTKSEWSILTYLVTHADEALSRERLLSQCLSYSNPMYIRAVDTHVKNLRIKVGPDWIETVHGYGYQFASGAVHVKEEHTEPITITQTKHHFDT